MVLNQPGSPGQGFVHGAEDFGRTAEEALLEFGYFKIEVVIGHYPVPDQKGEQFIYFPVHGGVEGVGRLTVGKVNYRVFLDCNRSRGGLQKAEALGKSILAPSKNLSDY